METDHETLAELMSSWICSATLLVISQFGCVCTPFSPPSSEKEAEKIKERLAQEEAEAMEMEDEENKTENANNDKEVCEEQNYLVEQQKTHFSVFFWHFEIQMCLVAMTKLSTVLSKHVVKWLHYLYFRIQKCYTLQQTMLHYYTT